MSDDLDSPKKSLAERFRAAREKGVDSLNIKPRDLAKELSRLISNTDEEGVRTLFDAYHAWRVNSPSQKAKGKTLEQIHDASLDNIDIIAQVVDALSEFDGDYDGAFMEVTRREGNANVIGPAQEFYRKCVNYRPPRSSLH